MIVRNLYRTMGVVALVFAATVACGGAASEQRAAKKSANPSATAPDLQAALLTEAELSGYRQRGVTSGTLASLGYQEVFEQLREVDADKPQCLNSYLGGISGPAYEGLEDAPAAMTIFSSKNATLGQMIVSVPAERAVKALDQPFPTECTKITADLPAGETMTMKMTEFDVEPIGDQVRAFRGEVVVAGKESVILSETVRSGGYVHNIQLRGGDRERLQELAGQALRKAGEQLA